MSGSAKQLACLCLVFVSCLLFLFYPGLYQSQIPAFRDGYHFYYPQAVWLDDCASRGEYFPQWDKNVGLGTSAAGQTSYAIYYPLRLIWLLPGCSVAQRYSLFIVLHLIIAALGTAYAARQLGLRGHAQLLAAISYSLSCPLLFQHNNLIYLTSAAWIGFALGAIIELTRTRGWVRSSLVFSGASSMMLLGGDPHTLANTLVVSGCAVVGNLLRRMWPRPGSPQDFQQRLRPILAMLAPWLLIVSITIPTVTAIQWVPMLRLALSSERFAFLAEEAEFASPRAHSALSETSPKASIQGEQPELLAQIVASQPQKRHRKYDFSLSPWHLATVVWPTLAGHYLPSHARWFALLPSEGRMWIPSLYFGLVPMLLVVGRFGAGPNRRLRWWIVLALLALLASFGNYSPVWLAREFVRGIGMPHLLDELPPAHVGSIYWVLTELVPGYDMLRYPAKWTVWFVAACSLAAAIRLDSLDMYLPSSGMLPTAFRRALIGCSLLVATVGLTLWGWGSWDLTAGNELLVQHRDAWLGTPQLPAIGKTICLAGGLPAVVLVVFSLIGRATSTFGPKADRPQAVAGQPETGIGSLNSSACLLLLTMVEMSVVSAWTMSFVEPPGRATLQGELPADAPVLIWSDLSAADFPGDVRASPSSSRTQQQAQYQNKWLLGKLASIPAIANLSATQSIAQAPLSRIKSWLARHDSQTSDQPELDRVLAQLGVTHRLVRTRDSGARWELSWQAVSNSRPLCEVISANTFDLGQSPDLGLAPSQNQLEWQWLTASQLSVDLTSTSSGTLVVRQFNDGGWIATSLAADGELSRYDPPPHGDLFVEIPISPGTVQVTLQRKPFW